MRQTLGRLAIAGAIAGVLGFGGISLASAQTETTPPTTEAPAQTPAPAPAPAPDATPDDGCDHDKVGGGAGEGASSATDA